MIKSLLIITIVLTLSVSACTASLTDNSDSGSEQTIITLGVVELLQSHGFDYTRPIVSRFNQANEHYYVEIINYSSDDISRFRTEMVAGSGPDVIYSLFFEDSVLTPMMNRGMLADLWQFIDTDPIINREDFFQNILEATQCSDGGLRIIANEFTVTTLISSPEIVNNPKSFTNDFFSELISNAIDSGVTYPLGEDMSGIGFLFTMLFYVDLGIIDLDAGESNLDSSVFYDLLKLASIMPHDVPFEFDYSPFARLRRGEQIFIMDAITNPLRFALYETLLRDFTVLGLPSTEGSIYGAMLTGNLGINANSPNQDAAWSFVREYLLTDVQMEFRFAMPMRIDLFGEQVKEAMTARDVLINADGEQVRISDEIFVEGGIEIPVEVLTAEGADELRYIVESISFISRVNETLANIILEELPSFFEGHRTAEEVVRIMQNRVQTYLSERS